MTAGGRAIRFVAFVAAVATACSHGPADVLAGNLPGRTFRMGFSATPPQLTVESVVATVAAWSPRADAAIMHLSVPYQALLTGTPAQTFVDTSLAPLANYYRSKGFPLTVTVDVTDGLNRAAESPELVALGRSITEPAVQVVYRQFVQAIVSQLRPAYLGLAAETNLIRLAAPANVYAAMVQMANAAAGDVQAMAGSRPRLYVSVQADFAWGPAPAGYQGVEQDFTDFPFMQALGISSYPYFYFSDPDQLPLDYYARLTGGRTVDVLVVEGGWPSAAAGTVQSTPEKQARYLRRQERLLDSAHAVAVLGGYTDIDVASYQQPPSSILPLFASLGLVDTAFKAKPALATCDSIFARPLVQP